MEEYKKSDLRARKKSESQIPKKNLEELKENYKIIQKKYLLPSFEDLNRDFGVERASEFETEFLIREIRKFVAEKSSNYLRFVDMVLNPVNAPMFVFSFIKLVGVEEKKRLSEIYKKLIKEEVRLLELDLEFSEEKEANFIKDFYKLWQEIKKDLLEIIEKVKSCWDNKTEGNSRGYFG